MNDADLLAAFPVQAGGSAAGMASSTEWTAKRHGFLAFDNDFFRSGDTAQGVVLLVAPAPIENAAALEVRLRAVEGVAGGEPRTLWGGNKRLWERGRDGDAIPAGTSTLPFSLSLPPGLPRSFEQGSAVASSKCLVGGGGGAGGKISGAFIRYSAELVLVGDRAGGGAGGGTDGGGAAAGGTTGDDDDEVLAVQSRILMCEQQPEPAALTTPLALAGAKSFLMSKGKLTVTAELQSGGVLTPGVPSPLYVTMDNQSKRAVSTVRVFLVAELGEAAHKRVLSENYREQDGCWTADLGMSAEAGGAAAGQAALALPSGTHGSVTRSAAVSLSYTLVVEAVVPSAMNLQVRMPVTVVEHSRGAALLPDALVEVASAEAAPAEASPASDGGEAQTIFASDEACSL
jgi:hypothetical protein